MRHVAKDHLASFGAFELSYDEMVEVVQAQASIARAVSNDEVLSVPIDITLDISIESHSYKRAYRLVEKREKLVEGASSSDTQGKEIIDDGNLLFEQWTKWLLP